ncbi:unnamed protein product [Mortierella alpina]
MKRGLGRTWVLRLETPTEQNINKEKKRTNRDRQHLQTHPVPQLIVFLPRCDCAEDHRNKNNSPITAHSDGYQQAPGQQGTSFQWRPNGNTYPTFHGKRASSNEHQQMGNARHNFHSLPS